MMIIMLLVDKELVHCPFSRKPHSFMLSKNKQNKYFLSMWGLGFYPKFCITKFVTKYIMQHLGACQIFNVSH